MEIDKDRTASCRLTAWACRLTPSPGSSWEITGNRLVCDSGRFLFRQQVEIDGCGKCPFCPWLRGVVSYLSFKGLRASWDWNGLPLFYGVTWVSVAWGSWNAFWGPFRNRAMKCRTWSWCPLRSSAGPLSNRERNCGRVSVWSRIQKHPQNWPWIRSRSYPICVSLKQFCPHWRW